MFTTFLFTLVPLILGVASQTCSMAGRYPVEGSNCKNYTHCTVMGTTIYETNFRCPSTSLFDARLQQCVNGDNYTCVDNICEARGPLQPILFTVYYGDPNDTVNKGYFTCYNLNGRWVPVYGTCNANQCFVYDEATWYRQGCCTSILTVCGSALVFDCRP